MSKIKLLGLATAIVVLIASCKKEGTEDGPRLNANFSFDKSAYEVGETVTITDETSGGSGGYTYAWDLGNGEESTEQNPTVVYDESGLKTITLNVTDTNGATAQSKKNVTINPEPVVPVGNLELKWVSSVPIGQSRTSTAAIAPDGSVYVVSNDHHLRKFNAADGTEMWNYNLQTDADGDLPKGNTQTTPSIDADGTIYVGTGQSSGGAGRVYAINPDGTKKWVISNDATTGFWNKGETSTPRINYLTVPIADNYVYVGNGGGTGSTLAVDKATGLRAGYVANADNSGGPAGGVQSGMVLTTDNKIIWSGNNNGLFGADATALAAAGGANITWEFHIYGNSPENNPDRANDLNATLAVDAENTIYGIGVWSDVPKAYAVTSAGVEKWRVDLEGVGRLDQGGAVIDNSGNIIVSVKTADAASTGGIISLNAANGAINWHYAIPESVSGVPAIDQAGNIHFGTESGSYYIIKPTAGDDQLLVNKELAPLINASNVSYKDSWVRTADMDETTTLGRMWSSPTIADDGTIYIQVTNNADNSKSAVVAIEVEGVTGVGTSHWPMKGRNAQHTSNAK